MHNVHAKVSIDIASPPEVVWEVVQSPALRPHWDLRIANYQTEGSPHIRFGWWPAWGCCGLEHLVG